MVIDNANRVGRKKFWIIYNLKYDDVNVFIDSEFISGFVFVVFIVVYVVSINDVM